MVAATFNKDLVVAEDANPKTYPLDQEVPVGQYVEVNGREEWIEFTMTRWDLLDLACGAVRK